MTWLTILVLFSMLHILVLFQPDSYDDVIHATREFDKLIETYPETIECHSQNKPISEVFQLKENDWDTPKEAIAEQSYVTLNSGHKSKPACFYLTFFVVQGCALRKFSGSPSGSQPCQLGCPALQVGRPK